MKLRVLAKLLEERSKLIEFRKLMKEKGISDFSDKAMEIDKEIEKFDEIELLNVKCIPGAVKDV